MIEELWTGKHQSFRNYTKFFGIKEIETFKRIFGSYYFANFMNGFFALTRF